MLESTQNLNQGFSQLDWPLAVPMIVVMYVARNPGSDLSAASTGRITPNAIRRALIGHGETQLLATVVSFARRAEMFVVLSAAWNG